MRADSDSEFEPTDPALREDVRRLGRLVGELLVEQVGAAFYQRVESARAQAIRLRRDGLGIETLAQKLEGLDAATADAVGRAFSTYFQVVNIAERVQRIRRRRAYQIARASPQPDGLHDVLLRLRDAGVGIDELLAALPRIDVEPVFTAHPTEASRRSLLEKEQEIVRTLVADFVGPRTDAERAVDWARLRMALTSGWQTADLSHVRPSVQDELNHVDFYLSDPLYRVTPVLYEVLEQAIVAVYGSCSQLPRIVRFASWVGGDMDGNPGVGAATIDAALREQRQLVLGCYRRECAGLARLLTQTLDRVAIADTLSERIASYVELLPEAARRIHPRHRNMPYRCLLQLVGARLSATARDGAGAYDDVAGLAGDIELIASSLRAHAGAHAGWFAVRRLQWRIATFGFHLARLDARQDSRVHASALAEVLGALPEEADARATQLSPYASGKALPAAPVDSLFGKASAVFGAFADARHRYGEAALGVYVISMAGSVADVLAVLALARAGSLVGEDGAVPLDIAPLFETIDDLRAAPRTFAALLADPVYRAHLGARGNTQTIMLGYSDSAKDGGILAARWALQRAQVELLDVARAHAVALCFFHGRGGSISRGGGKTSRAVMAAPRGAVDGRLRVTEQGEVIHQKYGIRALALRSLEQTVGAVLMASLRPRALEPREVQWRAAMHALADDGARAYRDLVGATPGFVDYFRLATPIDVIERMTLGSRPARRDRGSGEGGVSSLRAIPWVFAWSQCRAGLTGWYGVGSALDRAAARGHADMLAEMTRDWAFFRTLIEDLEMLLAKCDLGIAEHFSRLAGPLHDEFFPRIEREFQRTLAWVLRLRGNERLLADDPRLAESIRLRNPYIDPISLIQVDMLKRWRAVGSPDDAMFATLVSSVHGVAQALQNTG